MGAEGGGMGANIGCQLLLCVFVSCLLNFEVFVRCLLEAVNN